MAWALIPGDISGNGDIGLEEAVHALKVAAGLPSSVAVVPDPQTLVGKTGQTTSYTEGDDGDLERGVTLANPRFTDNSDGTVTDNLTDLIWLKNANAFNRRPWNQAFTYCNDLVAGGFDDWRLPNK